MATTTAIVLLLLGRQTSFAVGAGESPSNFSAAATAIGRHQRHPIILSSVSAPPLITSTTTTAARMTALIHHPLLFNKQLSSSSSTISLLNKRSFDAAKTTTTTTIRHSTSFAMNIPVSAAARQTRKQFITMPTLFSHHYLSSSMSTTTTTALRMVAKSGGKLIVTTEQFEMEVLGIGNTNSAAGLRDDDDNDDTTDTIIMTTTTTPPIPPHQPPPTTTTTTMPIQLVLFSAPWCGPCRLTVPIVRELQNLYPPSQLSVYEISTDDLPEVAELAGVSSIPTIVLYHRGEVRDTIVGCVNVKVLSRAVEKVLEDVGL